ncbi:phosphonoacetaldehyde hydrolase [Sphingomonas sp. ASY06-1R]|uniref:phosphonoacetaldehyde hydrolase n=1 Tax=Sphingomonas sp. ASY06-1R TaxID=3445771 RepID=UPI003FA26DDC
MARLKAVVFDWAGTMIDFGSRAPVVALCTLFAHAGVPIDEAEARRDMGLAKKDHIRAILGQPRIAGAWHERTGGVWCEDDVADLFDRIGPLMGEAARDCALLIPGAADIAQRLQAAGVRLGSCTGYSREMMTGILPRAADQGYRPDALVCAGETIEGRPSPLMLWKNLVELGVWPLEACVKVDDAEVGIQEGRAAGVWTIGVAASGNAIGLSQEALAALAPEDRAGRIAQASQRLRDAGAHAVIATVADLPDALATLPLDPVF